MPYNQNNHTIHRENFHQIRVTNSLFSRLISKFFDASTIVADADGQKIVKPGLIVALCTTTNMFVPYESLAANGVGSDTAVGVLDTYLDVTLGNEQIAPLYHGYLIEAYCLEQGQAVGTISAAVKTSLSQITWA